MANIAATNLITGRANYRESYAQVLDVVAIVNGIDANKIYSIRTGSTYNLGIPAPTAAPTNSAGGSGVTGTFTYRARWRDANTGTESIASPTLEVTVTDKTNTITRPTDNSNSRATHWVLERTTDGGTTFYPVNRLTATPNGTPIATTTFADSTSDSTIRNYEALINSNRQGVPGPYRCALGHVGRLFLFGGTVHRTTANVTNGNANVTSGTGFNSDMTDRVFSVATDTDGKGYKFTYSSATAGTIDPVYAGTTATGVSITIAGNRDKIAWSEARQAEHFGTQEVGFLSNELRLGDDGEATVAGVSMGPAGILWAKESRLFFHSFQINPDPVLGDGRIMAIQTRRGALGPMAMRFVEGRAFGMDWSGIWMMTPGGFPQEIGMPLAAEWKTNKLNFAQGDNFHIGYDQFQRCLYFFVCEDTDTYPKKAYIWNLEKNAWVGSANYPLGVTCSVELPDGNGAYRMNYYQENSGSAGSHMWANGIGSTLGVNPNLGTRTTGNPTAGASTTLTDSGANWPTSGQKLKGVAVRKDTSAGVTETRIIEDNTATVLTVSAAWTSNPTTTDTYYIGPIESTIRTGRIFAGFSDRKKEWKEAWIWVKYDSSAVPINCRVYHEGSTTANSDELLTATEDGVTKTTSSAILTVDPTVQEYRYKVPLNNKWSTDVQFEFYSVKAGGAWQIMEIKVVYDVDKSVDPRRT
jgi:hypothetical protein